MASPSDLTNADDFSYGFRRPEMYSAPLSGTVDAYDRHVFLCCGTHESWPANVEHSRLDPLPRVLSSALKSRKGQIRGKAGFGYMLHARDGDEQVKLNIELIELDFFSEIRLTLCEGETGGESCTGDVLIFPDMIKYRGLTHLDADGFVDDVFVRCSTWALRLPEILTGSHIFVCSHQNRDKRCGQCGPILVDNFIEEIELRGIKNKVFVSPCSHLGGHQYAGNLIIFGPGLESKCEGHWYGYVTPNDVPCLLDEHVGKGKIVERLWRGQMSSLNNEVKKLEEEKPKGNNDGKVNRALCCCSNDPMNCCTNKIKEENTGEGESYTRSMRQLRTTKGLGRL